MRLAGAVAVLASAACQGGVEPGPRVQIVGESVKVRRGDELPAQSAIFDGHVVKLRGARGELLGVQVLRMEAAPVAMELAIDGALVQAWRVDDVHVARASTDMYGPSLGEGDYPDRLTPGEVGAVTAGRDALFDVGIPADAVAGAHAGVLKVGGDSYAVALTIEPIDLQPIGLAPRVWGYYDAAELARVGDDEARVAAMFRDYGVMATPELTPADAERRAPMVQGARFVPVKLPEGREAIQRDARTWRAWSARTGQIAFAIPIDEPHTVAAKLGVRVIARWLHEAGGGVWLAVTDGPDWLYGDDVDVLCAPSAVGTGPPERRWTYNGAPPFAGAMIVDTDGIAMRTWGWIAWRRDVPLWYVWDVAYWRDRHNARRRGGTADAAPAFDATQDAVTFDDGEDHGNLDGVLFYPGGWPSLRLAALRRGLEDRALLDAVTVCAGRPAADAIAARVLGGGGGAGAWPTDEAAWEAARGALLDALLACRR